jgi:hypothetical protein
MNKIEKLIYGRIDLDKNYDNKIIIFITFNDMFMWGTSWSIRIISDFDKPIKAYKHLYDYIINNKINFYDQFDENKISDRPHSESILKEYFKQNQTIYNKLIDSLKNYNDYTQKHLLNQKFIFNIEEKKQIFDLIRQKIFNK